MSFSLCAKCGNIKSGTDCETCSSPADSVSLSELKQGMKQSAENEKVAAAPGSGAKPSAPPPPQGNAHDFLQNQLTEQPAQSRGAAGSGPTNPNSNSDPKAAEQSKKNPDLASSRRLQAALNTREETKGGFFGWLLKLFGK